MRTLTTQRRPLTVALSVTAFGLLATACTTNSSESEASTAPLATTTVAIPDATPISVEVVRVARLPNGGTAMATRPDDPGLYVTVKSGEVVVVNDGEVAPVDGVDFTGEVLSGGEQGLLGVVFTPDGDRILFYLTDLDGDSVLLEYTMLGPGRVDPESRREILRIPQPQESHNSGHLVFGPDGMLYIGFGDGGQSHSYNAQDRSTPYGSILRIELTASGETTYVVPPDNPFVGEAGAAPEIWVYGLRNPWKFSFDRATDDLWIGDVGNVTWEEVNMVPFADAPGSNFGWDVFEGLERVPRETPRPDPEPPVVQPMKVHGRDEGVCALIGGYVYRGSAIPELVGRYVYGDYCTKMLYELTPQGDGTFDGGPLVELAGHPWSLAEDGDGELYVISGSLFQVVPAATEPES